ncbi:MAG: YlxM family DNA-binding protein [Oscillospiraceae bacterium]|jgi:predicted DNA-binding protein YlxM (UPF0122 family)|nr:YlxM family DNA-binding protein [Oscillospiraceae bacterium]
MAKDLNVSVLLDFYGDMLTEKQREVVTFYYNEDLSLAEIAEHSGITRQGVRDAIKRAEAQLIECENRLGLWRRFNDVRKGLEEIEALARSIQDENRARAFSNDLQEKTQRIMDIANELNI